MRFPYKPPFFIEHVRDFATRHSHEPIEFDDTQFAHVCAITGTIPQRIDGVPIKFVDAPQARAISTSGRTPPSQTLPTFCRSAASWSHTTRMWRCCRRHMWVPIRRCMEGLRSTDRMGESQ